MPFRGIESAYQDRYTFATAKRNKAAALKFIKRVMRKNGRPTSIVTDDLEIEGPTNSCNRLFLYGRSLADAAFARMAVSTGQGVAPGVTTAGSSRFVTSMIKLRDNLYYLGLERPTGAAKPSLGQLWDPETPRQIEVLILTQIPIHKVKFDGMGGCAALRRKVPAPGGS